MQKYVVHVDSIASVALYYAPFLLYCLLHVVYYAIDAVFVI